MKVIVQTLDRKTVDVNVEENVTLSDLKNSIQEVMNHPADQMSVIFNGKKLSEYLIVDGTKIVLMKHKPKPTTQSTVLPTQTQTPDQNSVQPSDVSEQPTPDDVTQQSAQSSQQAQSSQPSQVNMMTAFNQALQNPQVLMQLLMSNPQFAQLAQQNPNAVQQLINNPNFLNSIQMFGDEDDDEDPLYEKYFDSEVQLTEEQKAEVNEITNMGFGSYEDTLQFYVAYGYSKDATVNALLDEKFKDD